MKTKNKHLDFQRQMAGVQLFGDYEDKTAEVAAQFVVLKKNEYIPRLRGVFSAADESMTCDCSPDVDENGVNHACGEDSDCINRLTNIECVSEKCTCGEDCQNQRFQKRQYANTSIFLTENKGYGMRANEYIPAGTFLIEYIGDIIDKEEYKVRKQMYDEEGLKHFYFMMIHDDEIIDACKRASMARYCNHSCDPNAYVDKWVVNKRFRMGIFAKRDIVQGEEICFDYNVDRYGAEPQKCYCGAANCLGVLGGKTQSESVRLLPHSITEALGVVASDEKKWLKEQKSNGATITKDNIDSNVNVEFVKSLQLEPLDLDEVPKVVGCLIQPELDLIVISRVFERIIMTTEDFDQLMRKFTRMHGLKVMGNSVKVLLSTVSDNRLNDLQKTTLEQIMKILASWPEMKTKNSVVASNLEESFKDLLPLLEEQPNIKEQITSMLEYWSTLQFEYRIPKKQRIQPLEPAEENNGTAPSASTQSMSKIPTMPNPVKQPWTGIDVSSLPANRVVDGFPLPAGWEWATDPQRNQKYYYNRESNITTWEKPEWPQMEVAHYEAKADPDSEAVAEAKKKRDRERQAAAEQSRIKALEKQRKLEMLKASQMEEERASQLSDIIKQAQREAEAKLVKQREDEEKERLKQEKKQNAILKRAAAKLASSSQSPAGEQKSKSGSSEQLHRKWVALFAKYVPHMLKKYDQEFIGRDNLKLFAKDISHILASKELKRHGEQYEVPKGLSEERLAKVKSFSKDYLHRQIEKIKEKKRKRKAGENDEGNEKKQKI